MSFEIILPFLRPIAPYLQDADVSEIMVNPGGAVLIERHGRLELTEGALYPTLHKLEAEGYLNTETVALGKRVRKYYTLTATGRSTARETAFCSRAAWIEKRCRRRRER